MASYRTPDDEPAHDVLAADEFAVPSSDPVLRHRAVVLPEDPSGIAEPHDILAAEEFAMPAGTLVGAGGRASAVRALERRRWPRLGAAAAVVAVVGIRRRRRLTHN